MIVLAAAVGAGCDREEQGAVRVAVIGDSPDVVDPARRAPDAADEVLLANAAQGLVRFDARGQVVPGLAERWNVSDDGLSYIFRLSTGEWPDGRKITAHQVARILRRNLGGSSRNPLADSIGSIDEIVAMTDRVLEIRLRAPRPHLLQLLAQPELAIVREGMGTGPFSILEPSGSREQVRLRRAVLDVDEEVARYEDRLLTGMAADAGVRAFVGGQTDLLLGGTYADLPHARSVRLPRGSLQFDPVSGLFGLVPGRASGPIADPDLRRLLSQAIDRDALIASLDVPGLVGRATTLEAGLEGVPDPTAPEWTATPIAERRPELIAAADRMFGDAERPTLKIALPEGPGSQLLLARLREDWGFLGIGVEPVEAGKGADLRLIDEVAPATSAAWFLRHFRCGEVPVCDEAADELLQAARAAPVGAQRAALLAEASRLIDEQQLFLPIAAPVRWSLVSDRILGFAGNRFGRHTLVDLGQKLEREGAQ